MVVVYGEIVCFPCQKVLNVVHCVRVSLTGTTVATS